MLANDLWVIYDRCGWMSVECPFCKTHQSLNDVQPLDEFIWHWNYCPDCGERMSSFKQELGKDGIYLRKKYAINERKVNHRKYKIGVK